MATVLKFVLAFLLLGAAVGNTIPRLISKSGWLVGSPINMPDGHIWNGETAALGDFPHQTVVYTTRGIFGYICGGSIISADWVLTAAHCVDAVDTVEVIAGSVSRYEDGSADQVIREADASKYLLHEDYDSSRILNDLALVVMDPPIDFNDNVNFIPLSRSEPPPGTVVILSGWGGTGDSAEDGLADDLQYADVQVVDDQLCQDWYRFDYDMMSQVICLDSSITRSSSCGGDSGGPMNYDTDAGRFLAGVTSWGSSSGCEGYLIGYVSVPYFLDWIEANSGVTPP